MGLLIGLVIFQMLVLPIIFVVWLALGKQPSRLHWALLTFLVGSYFLTIYLAGPWAWFQVRLYHVLPVLFLIGLVASFRINRGTPLMPQRRIGQWVSFTVLLLVGAIFFLQAMSAVGGTVKPAGAMDLAFPLKGGRFVVGQGGDSVAINYHNAYPTQTYALDIQGLTPFGRRAKGLLPKDLEDYAIYGAEVVSPCDGEVLELKDGLEEKVPGIPNETENPAGNYVALSCKGVTVLLAHMQPGSLAVEVGQTLSTGDPIGLAGNSGNTSEPHLHIHAERRTDGEKVLRGKAVPITFDGAFLVRGDIVER